MTAKKTYHAMLVEFATAWQNVQDDLSANQKKAISDAADGIAAMIDGPPTAEFVVGMGMGIGTLGAFEEQAGKANPLAPLLATLSGNSMNTVKGFTMMLVSCMAARLLEGVYEP